MCQWNPIRYCKRPQLTILHELNDFSLQLFYHSLLMKFSLTDTEGVKKVEKIIYKDTLNNIFAELVEKSFSLK